MDCGYITKERFLGLLDSYDQTKILSEELGKVFLVMSTKMFGLENFRYYTSDWKKSMASEALYTCCRYADRFKKGKGKNPHAYFSKVIQNSFVKYLRDKKKIYEIEATFRTKVLEEFEVERGDIVDYREDIEEVYERTETSTEEDI